MNTHDKKSRATRKTITVPRRTVMTKKPAKLRSAKVNAGTWTLASVLLSMLGACAPEMDPPSLVEKTRVIGARVEVADAPERAMPKPGEHAQVSWLVTAPGDVPPLGWAFALCAGRGGSGQDCGKEPLALFQGHDRPLVDLVVPAAEQLGGARELVLFGRICTASEPTLNDATGEIGCSRNGDGTTAVLSIPLAAGDEGNRNPSFAASAATFDGQPWVGSDSADCATLPHVTAASADHVLRLDTDGNDRELYSAMLGDPPVPTMLREPLQISQFTTAGKLERSYSTVESDDPSPHTAIEVKWKAPDADKVAAAGLVVRFTFVARDLRGGMAWTSRAACVVK
jgi:hypothetical protein